MNNKRWSQQYKQSVRRIRELILFDREGSLKELPILEEEIIERGSLLKDLNERKKFFEEAHLEIGIEPEYIHEAREELIREREEREAKLIALDKRLKAILIRLTAMFAVIGVLSIPIMHILFSTIISICFALEKYNNIHLGTNLLIEIFINNKTIYFICFGIIILGFILFKITVSAIERDINWRKQE